jgi:hypothetical protein
VIAEDLLDRLERVRKAGDRSWSARCPAHADKGPSLKVSDKDGTILIHCFAGCSVHDIAAAVGVNLSDLFPPRNPREAASYARERFTKATIKEFRHEITLVLIILADLCRKRTISDTDAARAMKARKLICKFLREIPAD